MSWISRNQHFIYQRLEEIAQQIEWQDIILPFSFPVSETNHQTERNHNDFVRVISHSADYDHYDCINIHNTHRFMFPVNISC